MNNNTLRKSDGVKASDTTRRYQLGMRKKLKKPDQFERERDLKK